MSLSLLKDWKQWLLGLIFVGIIGCAGNYVGYGIGLKDSVPAMLLLVGIAFVTQILGKLLNFSLPILVYTLILSTVLSLPVSPVSGIIVGCISKIKMMPFVTPILAYAGMSVGKNFGDFKKLGWKMVLIGMLVIFGTWIWSAVIAQVLLTVTGEI